MLRAVTAVVLAALSVTHAAAQAQWWQPALTDRFQYQLGELFAQSQYIPGVKVRHPAGQPGSVGGPEPGRQPPVGTRQMPPSARTTIPPLPILARQVYTLDGWDTPSTSVAWLRAQGAAPVCYFSAGTFEDWRSDAGQFLPSDKGQAMGDWPGEWWLNIRSDNVRAIMAKVGGWQEGVLRG